MFSPNPTAKMIFKRRIKADISYQAVILPRQVAAAVAQPMPDTTQSGLGLMTIATGFCIQE